MLGSRLQQCAPRTMGDHPAQPDVTIRLFGPISVEAGARRLGPRDFGGARPKQVLEILLSARGRLVPSDRLAELLWGDEPPDNAVGSLQTFVSVLRRHLFPDRECARRLVVTETEGYRLAVEHAAIDIDRFDDLLDQAGGASSEAARRLLCEALSLARGDVLEDEPYADWAQDLRGTYRGRVLGAQLEAADGALAACDYAAGLAHAQAGVELDRFSERAHRTAMLALYAMGRSHEALEGYHRLRTLLDDELGLEPTAQTRALETAVLRQDDVASLLPRPVREIQRRPDRPWLLFLGRRRELSALQDVVSRGLAGSFSIALVEAETGLGKTRLLDEFAGTLTGVRTGRAVCSAVEAHLPYVPLADALRGALAEVELGPEQPSALRQILPELAVGVPACEFQEIDALEALVELISRHAPLVLVLDDLHCADPLTIAALGYLQRRCANVAVAVIAAVRSEEIDSGHALRQLRDAEIIRLEALTAEELAPLGIPDAHSRTGGHAAFLADLIANGPRPDLRRSLSELLIARCRAEGAEAYRVLLTAAALEQPFEPELLATLLGADPVELTERVEQLCDRRILRIDGFRFSFRYAIVRDILAASLSPARRRLLEDRAHAAQPVGVSRRPSTVS